jgi:hypothetical protein
MISGSVAVGSALLALLFTILWLGEPARAMRASAGPAGLLSVRRVCASGCPYTSVQAVVDAAAPGDVIEIATGVYTGVTQTGGQSQIAYITKSLTLRGGYSADFTAWSPTTYSTTLDAQDAGRVIYARGPISLTLDGLRLIHGYHQNAGGGIYAANVDVRLLNSLVGSNRLAAGDGIGLHIAGGSLILRDSAVQENRPNWGDIWAASGGGIYASGATVELYDSLIMSNTAAVSNWQTLGRGGGVFLDNCASLLQRVTFRGNTGSTGTKGRGGGLGTQTGSLRLLDSTFAGNVAAAADGGAGGGAYLRTNYALVSGNAFTGNAASQAAGLTGSGGGLDIGNSWESATSIMGVTVTHNLLQGNAARDGGGMVAKTAVVLTVEDNRLIGNRAETGGGLSVLAKSDMGAPSAVSVRGNLFQDNTATNNGGGALVFGAVDVLSNRFFNNRANASGGAIYQGENSRGDNASAVYAGNLLIGNSANEGGGLYTRPEYSENLNITYRNMAFLGNTATSTGSGIFIRRYAKPPMDFKHLTLSGNTGGDGAMVYVVMGRVNFTNTILYSGTVGVKVNSGPVRLDHVLRYNVITPTAGLSWALQDTAPITAPPAFAADGYHLTNASAAIDAGPGAGVSDDIDGQPRPLGTAPDIGADESPYTLAPNGIQASKLADDPRWKVYYTGLNVPPSTYFEQTYLIPFAYHGVSTAPPATAYAIQDQFPAALNLAAVENPADLAFTRNGAELRFASQASLTPGQWSWVGLIGRSESVAGGQTLVNSGQMSYTLANGNRATLPFSVTTQVPPRPIFPPVLITPLDGEMCLEAGNQLIATGVAGVGMTVRLYEDGAYKGQTTATATGEFTLTWTSGLTLSQPSIAVHTVACESGAGGMCSAPSRTVHLSYPQADWCPQRSYWEGDAFGVHHVFHFRNDQGRYASNDFVLPGVFGFWNTKLHLYSCCDHNNTNPFKVTADNVVYQTPSAHNGRWWTFDIGAAHEVFVESQCQGGGAPPKKTTQGVVLIDPDGFVFDVDAGGGYDVGTGVFSPVKPLAGITVTVYVSVPEWSAWVPWPAHLYNNQINPQVTGNNGYFAFFTPPGYYYLQASGAHGYQAWRSPIVQVVTEIVHVNIPLTPWVNDAAAQVLLTPAGPNPAVVRVPPGRGVEWLSTLADGASAADLVSWTENPAIQPRTDGALDPLLNTTGFDAGRLPPGQTYRRKFAAAGVYPYSDGLGRAGTIIVAQLQSVYLPLVLKK